MTQNNWSDKFTAFAVGLGVGALLALLFAPSSGEETRDYLTGTLKRGLNNAASTGKRWTRRAREKGDDVKASVAGAVEAGEKVYRTARDA
jgi:gas vesicle protein